MLVVITWEDTISDLQGWKNNTESKEWASEYQCLVKSAGWIIEENKEYVILAGLIMNGGEERETNYSHLLKIPRTAVKKVDTIGRL